MYRLLAVGEGWGVGVGGGGPCPTYPFVVVKLEARILMGCDVNRVSISCTVCVNRRQN